MSVNIPIWPGSGSFVTGSSTPFGYFDTDTQFQSDAPKVAEWCAKRLENECDLNISTSCYFCCFQ